MSRQRKEVVSISYCFGMRCSSKDCIMLYLFFCFLQKQWIVIILKIYDRLDLMEDMFRFEGCKGWTVLGVIFELFYIFLGFILILVVVVINSFVFICIDSVLF